MTTTFQALINGGDWACSFADSEGLYQVCQELAQRLGKTPALVDELRKTAHCSAQDMCAASRQWSMLSQKLKDCLKGVTSSLKEAISQELPG